MKRTISNWYLVQAEPDSPADEILKNIEFKDGLQFRKCATDSQFKRALAKMLIDMEMK